MQGNSTRNTRLRPIAPNCAQLRPIAHSCAQMRIDAHSLATLATFARTGDAIFGQCQQFKTVFVAVSSYTPLMHHLYAKYAPNPGIFGLRLSEPHKQHHPIVFATFDFTPQVTPQVTPQAPRKYPASTPQVVSAGSMTCIPPASLVTDQPRRHPVNLVTDQTQPILATKGAM